MNKILFSITLGVTFAVTASCATTRIETKRETRLEAAQTRAAAESDLCSLNRPISSKAVSTVIIGDGSTIIGDVSSYAQLSYQQVWTAFAAPAAEVIQRESEEAGYCSQEVSPGYFYYTYYQDCPTVTRYELGDVYGLGRGPNRGEAEALAYRNCQTAVDRIKRQYRELDRYRYDRDLECIMTVQVCQQ